MPTNGVTRRTKRLRMVSEPPPSKGTRTLWQAELQLREGDKESMLFRSVEDFDTATRTAINLLEASPGAKMSGAVIVRLERVARLWN